MVGFSAACTRLQDVLEEPAVMPISLQTQPKEHARGFGVKQSQQWIKVHCINSTGPEALGFTMLLQLPLRWKGFPPKPNTQ